MELQELFAKTHELTGKFPNLSNEDTKTLRILASRLQAECASIIWEQEYYANEDKDE